MKVKQVITLDKQKIKEILVAIREPENQFKVYIKKAKSVRRNGSYCGADAKITLYLLNFNNNNEIIKTAIHEYAHHFVRLRGHPTEFWNCYFQLLEIAEEKGFYSCDIEKSEKLKEITTIIKRNDLLKNRKLFKEILDLVFSIIYILCDENDINFQYYTVKYLEMDWYKKPDPNSSFDNIFRKYIVYNRNCIYEIIMDDFLPLFLKYCQNISGNEEIIENKEIMGLYIEVVKQMGRGWLEYLPEKLKTAELCLETVKQDGRELEYIPRELKTTELCLEAVKQDGWLLKYVPKELKTEELCLEALKQNVRVLQYVPSEFKTAEICLEAVKQYNWLLKHVPKRHKTAELCLTAVKQDFRAIEYISNEFKTTELCLEAIKQNVHALIYVPNELKTAELCLVAVKQNGWALKYVPNELKTAELCLEAVKQDSRALKSVPDELISVCL